MKKLFYISAAILLVAGLATGPALAQGKLPMKSHRPVGAARNSDIVPTPTPAMAMKPHHTQSCYDYAWESQTMNDCLAGKSAKPMGTRSTKKAAAPKMS